jgi:hypothetical protein
MPYESPRILYLLQFSGLFFAMTVLGGGLLLLAKGISQLSIFLLGLFILYEVVLFITVRKTLQKHKQRPKVGFITPVKYKLPRDNDQMVEDHTSQLRK